MCSHARPLTAFFDRSARFPHEIEREILRHCDMITLLYSQDIANRFSTYMREVLRADRRHILAKYVPDPEHLLDLLHQERAVVIGDAALALVLRDLSILGIYLDIALPCTSEGVFEAYLQDTLHARCIWHSPGRMADRLNRTDTLRPFIKLFHLQKGILVRLFYSQVSSAIENVVWSSNSAHVNYFNRTSLGCAYPLLTFRRVGLAHSWFALTSIDRRCLAHLLVCGFKFTHIPPPLMGSSTYTFKISGARSKRFDCYRSLYVCPDQERFLGDPGSMIIFFDTHPNEGMDGTPQSDQVRFGAPAVWRMYWGELVGRCVNRCSRFNRFLPYRFTERTLNPADSRDIPHHGGRFKGMRLLRDCELPVSSPFYSDTPPLTLLASDRFASRHHHRSRNR